MGQMVITKNYQKPVTLGGAAFPTSGLVARWIMNIANYQASEPQILESTDYFVTNAPNYTHFDLTLQFTGSVGPSTFATGPGGTTNGALQFTEAGVNGQNNLEFIPASGTNRWPSELNFETHDFSVGFWVYLDSASVGANICEFFNNVTFSGIRIGITSGDAPWINYQSTAGGKTASANFLSASTWQSVVITNSGGGNSGTHKFYSNKTDTAFTTNSFAGANINTVVIGCAYGTDALQGRLYNFCVWDRVLSQSDVNNFHNSG